jgi:uncharacterized protein
LRKAFGLLQIFILTGKIPEPVPGSPNDALGLWFVGLAYMTGIAAIAATTKSLGIGAVLWTLAVGPGLSAAGWFLTGIGSGWLGAGGVLFVVSAGLAAYMVLAMSLTAMMKRTIPPLGHYKKNANLPGRQPLETVELPGGPRHQARPVTAPHHLARGRSPLEGAPLVSDSRCRLAGIRAA